MVRQKYSRFSIALASFMAISVVPVYTGGAGFALAEVISDPWQTFIWLDRNYNISDRDWRRDPETNETFPVYQADIPRHEAEVFESIVLDDATKRLVYPRHEVETVRFYVVGDRALEGHYRLDAFRKKFGPSILQPTSYRAVKLTSRSTFFVWSPGRPDFTPFCLKMGRRLPGEVLGHPDQGEIATSWAQARVSVANNDYVEAAIGQDPDPIADVLPERFAASVRLDDSRVGDRGRYVFLMRQLRPSRWKATPFNGEVLIPIHGLLGHNRWFSNITGVPVRENVGLARFDSEFGWRMQHRPARKQWVQNEFIPKLARYAAVTHFKYGYYSEDHTQNLLVRIEPNLGTITGFVSRDLGDVLLAPALKVLTGGFPDLSSLLRLNGLKTSLAHHHFVDTRTPELRDVGRNSAGFLAQTIIASARAIDPVHPDVDAAFLRFAEEYRSRVEEITGMSGITADIRKSLVQERWFSRSEIRLSVFRDFVQGVYDRVTRRWRPGTMESSSEMSQGHLRRMFARHLERQQVGILKRGSLGLLRSRVLSFVGGVRYRLDGNRIFALNAITGEVLAIAFGEHPGECVGLLKD